MFLVLDFKIKLKTHGLICHATAREDHSPVENALLLLQELLFQCDRT